MSNRRLRAVLAQAGALVLGGAVFLVTPARAVPPPDSFTCRASVVRVEGGLVGKVEPFVANGNDGACVSDDSGLIGPQDPVDLPGGLGSVQAAYAVTDAETNTAKSGVANIDLTVPGLPAISADVLQSEASAGTCAAPGMSGSSTVLSVTVGDTNITVPADNAPEDVQIANLGTLYLNYQDGPDSEAEDQVLTQRALFLDIADNTLLPDVIVAESIADIHGDPCEPPVVDEGRCPAPSPEGQDATPDEDCGFGKPSDVDEAPKGGRNK